MSEKPGDIVTHSGKLKSRTNIEIAVQVPPPKKPENTNNIDRLTDFSYRRIR